MPMDLYQQEINDLCMPLKPQFEEFRLPPHSETTEYKTNPGPRLAAGRRAAAAPGGKPPRTDGGQFLAPLTAEVPLNP